MRIIGDAAVDWRLFERIAEALWQFVTILLRARKVFDKVLTG